MPEEQGLERLNALPAVEAEAELLNCCGSRAWARAMVERRPYADMDRLLEEARLIWWTLEIDDWLEAFRSHPRIGERKAAGPVSGRSAEWSRNEQAGADTASPELLRELADANQAYEERFGHIFLVCAAGKGAAEMLELLRERLGNDPGTELRVAAEEQAKVTELRLRKLLDP